MRYELRNRLPQVLPITLRSKEDPKEFVYGQIANRGRRIIEDREMTGHIDSLKNKGFLKVIALTEAGKKVQAPKLKSLPKKPEVATITSNKKSSRPSTRRKKK